MHLTSLHVIGSAGTLAILRELHRFCLALRSWCPYLAGCAAIVTHRTAGAPRAAGSRPQRGADQRATARQEGKVF